MKLLCLIALLAVAAAAGALSASADAASCRSVHVRGEATATHVRTYNHVTCREARRNLRRWMRTRFPRNQLGWFCETRPRRKLCSRGNGGGAPYFTFRLRR